MRWKKAKKMKPLARIAIMATNIGYTFTSRAQEGQEQKSHPRTPG